ncbi:MAG: methylmalonyl Co-A mutase-associated GTPase MeaB [Myxococcales bacterium]|nr:MAG: methylmalonyl Co-A mutase-associated GTPase MeaB [Myxococcales bacterium]
MTDRMVALAEEVVSGSTRAAARAIRLVDDRSEGYERLLATLYPYTGKAMVLGITGTPGAGKSTLVAELVTSFRKAQKKVGVLAVDPSSPFSGGAILGDRIRMQDHFLDPGVFIRSIATRGALGGLSFSALDLSRVLDAFGCEVVIVETVGVGQDELDIARLADTTVVVSAPGLGDDIQAVKAGILEIADVFVVNKSDKPGADAAVADLEHMVALGYEVDDAFKAHHHGTAPLEPNKARCNNTNWEPVIIKTVAATGQGVDELMNAVGAHQRFLFDTEPGKQKRREKLKEQMGWLLEQSVLTRVRSLLQTELDEEVERVLQMNEDPYTVVREITDKFLRR